jgi:hypothetical protein
MVVPTNLNPLFFKLELILSERGVFEGISLNDLKLF